MTFCSNSKDKEKTIQSIVCNVYYNFGEQHINFNFIEIFCLRGMANCFDVFVPHIFGCKIEDLDILNEQKQ